MVKRALAFAALVAIVVGCSNPDTVSLPAPGSPASTSPPSGGTSSSTSSSPQAYNSVSPTPGARVGTGQAHITGPEGTDISLDFSAVDPYSFYGGPKAQSSLVFFDSKGDTLSIGGVIHKGTFKTSGDLSLTITAMGAKPLVLVSGDGSCRLTIDSAPPSTDVATVSGSFRCKGLAATRDTSVNASGTFSGTIAPSG